MTAPGEREKSGGDFSAARLFSEGGPHITSLVFGKVLQSYLFLSMKTRISVFDGLKRMAERSS
jgi:hypothetical protein